MSSPLVSGLEKVFMCSFENKWLTGLKPVFYRQHFVYISTDHAKKFE